MNAPLTYNRPRIFRSIPDTSVYYPYPSIQTAFETALRAVIRAEGPVVILGGAGYGKSLLAELISEELSARMDVVRLQSARLCSRQALLQNILFELKLPYRDLSEGELRLSILERLEPSPETAPEGILIVVDEAQTLPSKLLDELRLLTNTFHNDQPRVRLVLLGNMRLEETLASPTLDSFNQRIAARCFLQPMNRDETAEFIRHQFRTAGFDPDLCISREAIHAAHAASDGIPRLVNQLMDHSIVLLSKRDQDTQASTEISVELINEAWADLQQLPAPWTSNRLDSVESSNGTAVEYGPLYEELNTSIQQEDIEPEPEKVQNYFAAFSDLEEWGSDASLHEDAEKLEAVLDDLQTYDNTGIWENDPPLARPFEVQNDSGAPQLGRTLADGNFQVSPEDLFGNDFDLEQTVTVHAGNRSVSTTCSSSNSFEPSEDSQGYVDRIEQVANAIDRASRSVDHEDFMRAIDSEQAAQAQSTLEATNQHWTLDIVPQPASHLPLEESIEEIVSQLNFSAFQVEPFSVEQIPLSSSSIPSPGAPADSIRSNGQKRVLMMHRPTKTKSTNPSELESAHGSSEPMTPPTIAASNPVSWAESMDDDRDILIIEESVSPIHQVLNESLPVEPMQKTTPYSQLFARLRK